MTRRPAVRALSVIFSGRAAPRALSELRNDHGARRLQHLVQARNRRDVARVQVAAFILERAREDVEPAVGQRPDLRFRLHRGDMDLQHLEIVQPAQRVLRLLDRAQRSGRGLAARLERQLHRVAKLLRGNPDLVELLGRIHVSRLSDGGAKKLRPLHQPRTERVAPLLRVGLGQFLGHRRQPAIELGQVDVLDPLEHFRPAFVALEHDVRADLLERGTRQRIARRQLVEDLQRHVELAHGAERFRQPPNLALRLLRLRALHARGQHGQGFAQPPRRDAGLMDAARLAADGLRYVTFQDKGPPRKQPACDTRKSTVHDRMAARIGRKTASICVCLRTAQPVYNGHVTAQARPSPPLLPACESLRSTSERTRST